MGRTMASQKVIHLKWVAFASLLNNTGAAFIWPLTTMYVNKYLHQTLTTAGIVMLFISLSMMAGNYPVSYTHLTLPTNSRV